MTHLTTAPRPPAPRRRHVHPRWYLGAAMALFVAVGTACGGDDSVASTTTAAATTTAATTTTAPPTTAPPTTAPPTTAPPTTEAVIDYQQAYRRANARRNCARSALIDFEEGIFGVDDSLSFEEATRRWEANRESIGLLSQEFAAALRDTTEQLDAVAWPAEVQADTDTFAEYNRALAEVNEAAAVAEDYLTFYEIEGPADTGTAGRIRAALGLPSAADDTTDWCALAAS